MMERDVTHLFIEDKSLNVGGQSRLSEIEEAKPKPVKVSERLVSQETVERADEFKCACPQETTKRAVAETESNAWLVAMMTVMMAVIMVQALPILLNLSADFANRVNSLIASTQMSCRPF